MLLLAVLIQAAFGCFWRHSHGPIDRADAAHVVSGDHHHHGHGHSHGGHHHGTPPPAHFHLPSEGGEEHQHEQSGDDTFHYVIARGVTPPTLDVAWVGHTPLDAALCAGVSAEPVGRRERCDAFGRSGWPSGQRLSLFGVWLI
ncbi:MAG TPA: hypothetical protein VF170_15825 [Planctomycetaceae bacterium]